MTVRSDRPTWLTKIERIGELSAQNKHLVFNNIGHLINAEMLKEQYQRLDRNKAIGIDKVTKAVYGENLDENISDLVKRISRGTYKPKPARIVEIPKEDGSKRPLAISCLEDKLVQLAISTILSKIYEPLFLKCSYGFRPNQSCHSALRALNKSVSRNGNGAVVEIDIRKYFNTIPHVVLMKLLRDKISDRRMLKLIKVLITAPIMEGKLETKNTRGCPQGSILSPILANIYLHHVVDEWFETIKSSHIRGRAELIRYADDMVFTFAKLSEAKRFYEVLPKRLSKYGLDMHPDKSQVIPAGHAAAVRVQQQDNRLPTFNFLGFTCYWGKARKGFWRLKYTTRKDRFAAKLKGMKRFLRENLTTRGTGIVLKMVIRVVKGWINYYAISDNQWRVSRFLEKTKWLILRWLNRRGGKHPVTWDRLLQILKAIGFPRQWKTVSMF